MEDTYVPWIYSKGIRTHTFCLLGPNYGGFMFAPSDLTINSLKVDMHLLSLHPYVVNCILLIYLYLFIYLFHIY